MLVAPPPPPPGMLQCPAGQVLDKIPAPGDNGSCDCDKFCATDWVGSVKKSRPHWTGAASAVPNATTQCECVQATHFCMKNPSCTKSCDESGRPTPHDYCIKSSAPAPAPGPPLGPTTSMVGVGDCNQPTSDSEHGVEISASGAYMAAQSAMPFANPGHLRGLTLQRLFTKVLDTGAPHLFMSSFNEHIGGRQPAASKAKMGGNMVSTHAPHHHNLISTGMSMKLLHVTTRLSP